MTMTVDLGPQLERAVEELISKGRYRSKSEVLREGIRLVQDREAHLAALHAELEKGLAAADAGDVYPIEDVLAEFEARYGGVPGVAEE
jgi:antitoxin ParD1/3/4